jgi:hypothetical protein
MKYIFLLLLTGCSLSAQNDSNEQKKDAEYQKLINDVKNNHNTFNRVQAKAKAKETKLVYQAISKIAILSEEVKSLKNDISKIKVDTIYIHDTIQIKEKKNFWGKTKVDTTNN